MIYKSPGMCGKVCVTFCLPATFWADTIHLVGDFNNWDTSAVLLRLDDKNWSVTLELEANQSYQYRYLVNSTDWVNDWQADHFAPSESGGDNSVVITLLADQANAFTDRHRYLNHQRPYLRMIQGGRQEKQAV
jgi:1,4-alpha-glucan branching enzyme